MNATVGNVNIPSNETAGRPSRRLGVFSAAAIALLSALALAGAVPGQPGDGSAKAGSGYTQIDTSDHPTNPSSCRSRFGC